MLQYVSRMLLEGPSYLVADPVIALHNKKQSRSCMGHAFFYQFASVPFNHSDMNLHLVHGM